MWASGLVCLKHFMSFQALASLLPWSYWYNRSSMNTSISYTRCMINCKLNSWLQVVSSFNLIRSYYWKEQFSINSSSGNSHKMNKQLAQGLHRKAAVKTWTQVAKMQLLPTERSCPPASFWSLWQERSKGSHLQCTALILDTIYIKCCLVLSIIYWHVNCLLTYGQSNHFRASHDIC